MWILLCWRFPRRFAPRNDRDGKLFEGRDNSMKKLFICVLMTVLLLTFCGCSQKEETAPTFLITENNQEFLKDGVVTGTDNYTYTYNDDGLAIYSERHQDGFLYSTTSWEYDEFGNPVKITTEGNDGIEISEYKNTLDNDGRIIKEEVYINGELLSVAESTYDEDGNEVTYVYTSYWLGETDWHKVTKTYDSKGKLICKTQHRNISEEYIIWEYEDELCVRQTTYESETDKIVEYWVYTYDKKGNQLRKSRYDEADNLSYYTEYTWDDTGRVQTERNYNADGTPRNHFDVFTYDEFGNQILQERYRDGEVYWRIRYVYEQLEAG